MLHRATKQSRSVSQIASLASLDNGSLAMTDVMLRRFAPRNDER